jgi:hypothetical protein
MSRILVCGGRDFVDHVKVNRELAWYAHPHDEDACWDDLVIIHGGARGADTLAGLFAKMFGLKTEVYPADWETHGKAAGYIRNKKMLDEGKPDFVVAFPGGKGTNMMKDIARKAGVHVIDVE